MIERMTLQEASKALDMSIDGLRKRLYRGSIKGKKDKRGRWIIEIDQAELQAANKDKGNDIITILQDEVKYLKEENARKDHIIMNLTNRIPQLEAPKRWGIFRRNRGES